ncbi:maleylpyruvate isomerase family mycothiol-dependent enzyme [Saccharopolyspora erythraea]|uniref:maleylpyruvate isomerase family mycothiol-dependent enzyme n=1 Tax=Saccharopolyspora erythraea TaxID=1836 RepID=UPI001BA602FC|nr:maleylpyruvate isomerase family mycothiol-dependent enzyme [Saccharopolyspora erythraea]QUH03222.1 maleylpyruvate isomerase family mycothiol-dependent enzyme [Saccharopolyspora erythraea]
MPVLDYVRYCDEIVVQTDLLRTTTAKADMTTPVPSCPGWNVGQLLRHLGGCHRWVERIVRTRSAEFLPDDDFRDLTPYTDEDATVLDGWLAEGAALLAGALRAAGPDARIWSPVPAGGTAFFARRMAHETVVHRADATLALGKAFEVREQVALDCLDEWMELGSLPQMFEFHPEKRELLGPGRTLHLHATDTAPEARAEWVVDLTGDAITWRRAHEKCAVAVRGPLTDLLLVVYRRRSPYAGSVEVVGDTGLLDFWLERVGFG